MKAVFILILLPFSSLFGYKPSNPEVAVAIIGKGPSALACAEVLTQSGIPVAILFDEMLDPPKEALSLPVEMVPLINKTSWKGVISTLQSEVKEEILLTDGSGVQSIQGVFPSFQITTRSGLTLSTYAVVFAMGSEPNKLGVTNEDKLFCNGLFYKIYNPISLLHKRVVIIGESLEALEEVQQIVPFATQIFFISRRVGNLPQTVIRKDGRVLNITKITKETLSLSVQTRAGIEEMKADFVFVLNGSKPRSDLIWSFVECDSRGYVTTPIDSQKTSRQGAFACGTLTSPEAEFLSTAVSQGARAGREVRALLLESNIGPKDWKPMADMLSAKYKKQAQKLAPKKTP